MKSNRLALLSILLVVGSALLCSACGGGSDEKSNDISYLYVQNADAGTFVDTGNGFFVLKLRGLAPITNYFSDREQGVAPQAGVIGTDKFFADWSNPSIENNFSVDPPVAALDFSLVSGIFFGKVRHFSLVSGIFFGKVRKHFVQRFDNLNRGTHTKKIHQQHAA